MTPALMNQISALLAWLTMLVAVPLAAWAVWRLFRLSRLRPEYTTLRERKLAAVGLLGIALVFGPIFLSNDLPEPILNLAFTKLITRLAVFAIVTVLSVRVLRLYRGVSFQEPQPREEGTVGKGPV